MFEEEKDVTDNNNHNIKDKIESARNLKYTVDDPKIKFEANIQKLYEHDFLALLKSANLTAVKDQDYEHVPTIDEDPTVDDKEPEIITLPTFDELDKEKEDEKKGKATFSFKPASIKSPVGGY